RARKTERLERAFHGANGRPVEIRDKRRGNARIDRSARCDKLLCNGHVVADFLCALRASYKAMTAKDAFLRHDVCLIIRTADRFHRAVTNTFVAVFAIGLFKPQALCHANSLLCSVMLRSVWFLASFIFLPYPCGHAAMPAVLFPFSQFL